jgi:hypothetical protein
MAEDSASIRSLRSPLGRVRGMGSAKGARIIGGCSA